MITIDSKSKINSLQEAFSQLFPYLRLEFFFTPLRSSDSKKNLPITDKTWEDVRTIHTTTAIRISPEMTVGELENQFKTVYGLDVQVVRKSGKMWLETTLTDSWTLAEQNKQGEELSRSSSGNL